MRRFALAGAIAAALALGACQGSSPYVHAKGTALHQGGKAFSLRSAALLDDATLWDSAKTDPSAGGIAERDWAFVAAGLNAVRLAVKMDYFVDDRSEAKPSGFAWLDHQLAFAKRLGLLVIIDMHVPPGGAVQDYRVTEANQAFWASAELQNRFVEGWKEIARRYRGETRILGYELMNEPSTAPGPYWDLMERTVAAIREVDGHHAIIVQPTADGKLRTLPDANLVVSYHFYAPTQFTCQNIPGEASCRAPGGIAYPGIAADGTSPPTFFDRGKLRGALTAILSPALMRAVPVIIGEFGVSTSADEESAGRWIGDVVSLADEFKLAGYSAWRQVDRGTADLARPANSTMAVINGDGSYYSRAQFAGIRPAWMRRHPDFDGRKFFLGYSPAPDEGGAP